MTNENLTSMVKGSRSTKNQPPPKKDMDLPKEEVVEEQQEDSLSNQIGITRLTTWFDQNAQNFDNVNQVKVAIRGIDPNKTMIIAVKDLEGGKDEEGNDKRKLRIFENAHLHPVLNLPAISMDVYNNGFRVINEYSNEIYIKSYGVRTGLICVFCSNVDAQLIPYITKKVNKKDIEFELIKNKENNIKDKLSQKADLEALQLLYKQSKKIIDELETNADVVNWLLERQAQVTDINHHLQIDSVLIDMLR